MKTILFFAATILTSMLAIAAGVQKHDAERVDSILERLEQQLQIQEQATYIGPTVATKKAKTEYRFEGDVISGSSKEVALVQELAKEVSAIEAEVFQLNSDVQLTKQRIIDAARVDNFVEIEVRLGAFDKAVIKTMKVNIDGQGIYELNESSGIWIPSEAIPLYSGPMKPGTHRLDLEARIALTQSGPLPVATDVYRFVNRSFSVIVPNGTVRRKWKISIDPPDDHSKEAIARLVDASHSGPVETKAPETPEEIPAAEPVPEAAEAKDEQED